MGSSGSSQGKGQSGVNASPAPSSGVLQLRITEDKMKVLLSSDLPQARYGEIEAALTPELKRIGVLEDSAVAEALQNLRSAIADGTPLSEFPVLEGTPPVPAQDGTVEWTRDFFKKGFIVDPETGTVDYRERLAEDTVHSGDRLGTVTEPVPGKEGIDVFGKRVATNTGRPANVKSGVGVRVQGEDLFADADGRIRFLNGLVAVDNVLTIDGSIGLKSGHINHPGALVVKQNVDAESRIETTGSIEVAGYVEDAEITTGGDLIVGGGIIGEPGRMIRVEGQVHAKFLKNVHIEASGDVVVLNGIEQCTVLTQGSVQVPQGRIVGGEIVALHGIDAGFIGSEACVPTKVTSGQDYKLSQRMEEHRAEIKHLEDNLEKVQAAIAPHKTHVQSLAPDVKKKYVLLLKQTKQISDRIRELEAEIETLPDESKSMAKMEIMVRKCVFPGTSATIGRLTKQVRDEVSGPTVIAIRRGDVRFILPSKL